LLTFSHREVVFSLAVEVVAELRNQPRRLNIRFQLIRP
jgi:hypothetical protein